MDFRKVFILKEEGKGREGKGRVEKERVICFSQFVGS